MARNEFGVLLDKNGYAPSLLQHDGRCYVCGYSGHTERHEIFSGPFRQKSKRLGCWCHLCADCHRTGHRAARKDKDTASWLKRKAQNAAMKRYRWSVDEFILRFGKSHLEVEDED